MSTTTLPQSHDATASRSVAAHVTVSALIPYVVVGAVFGIILVKSEVISWYRIQEMFRFQSFHMYGVLGSAWFTALVSLQLLKRAGVRDRNGEPVGIPPKVLGKATRYWAGGAIFGAGWALSGACPGPLYALTGSGMSAYAIVALAALAGAWVYGFVRDRLPH